MQKVNKIPDSEMATAIIYFKKTDAKVKKYEGKDNTKNPKYNYIKKLIGMSDEELAKECERKIWFSNYAKENPKADYHYQHDACQTECKRRSKEEIYNKAQRVVSFKAGR